MPLPLGHTAIGLMTFEVNENKSAFRRWQPFMWIVLLANLPDIDVLIGLVFHWNANAFHRGPTHSLLFAVVAGCLAHQAGRRFPWIPELRLRCCILLILSHTVADAFLTTSPVSFWWPLETNWSAGQAGWRDVLDSILFGGLQDAGIVLFCLLVLLGARAVKRLAAFYASAHTATAAIPKPEASLAVCRGGSCEPKERIKGYTVKP